MNARTRYRLRNLPHRLRGWRAELAYHARLGFLCPTLSAKILHADGTVTDLGVISRRSVTNAGVAFLVSAFQNLTEAEAMNFHASGTGSVAENVTDTALGTEVESRSSGAQSAPSGNVYRTVGTVTYTATRAITEHGIFSAATVGTLWDRSVFTAINVVSGDSIQFQYDLTVNAGG